MANSDRIWLRHKTALNSSDKSLKHITSLC